MDEHFKKSIIIEHYNNPLNKGETYDNSYIKINMNSPSCIDNLDYMVKIENKVIEDIKFNGEACAISTASSSIMTSLVKGKTIEEAKIIIENYENMINEKEYNEEILKEANAFDTVYKQANRKKCALLPYEGLKKALEEKRN